MSCLELVVELGNEYHARCDYCGATEGTDWRKREFKLYCSKDCQRAGEMLNWLCTLVIMIPITFVLIAEFGLFSFAFPFNLLFLLFDVGLIYAVYQGTQASNRVAQRRKTKDIY